MEPDGMVQFHIRRDWWFPFVVGVWRDVSEGEDWKRGRYTEQKRVAVFVRTQTAQRWIAWTIDKETARG